MFTTTPRILYIVQDIFADPLALLFYLFILNEVIKDTFLVMSENQPEDVGCLE